MPGLRDFQLQFADAILSPRSPADRLQIYRNNVLISLTGALADVYPVTQRLVGEGFFAQAARRFIRWHPPRSGNIHDFGRELPLFLATLAETAALPYLPDVAALERAHHEVFHAADAPLFDFAKLAEPAVARLRLHPALRLVASRYPVLEIWEANQAEDVRTVDLDAGGDFVLVMRRGLQRSMQRLSAGAFALLQALSTDSTLSEACDAALAAEAGLDLYAAMGRLVRLGVFAQEADL